MLMEGSWTRPITSSVARSGAFLGYGVRGLRLLPSARDLLGGDRYGALPTFR